MHVNILKLDFHINISDAYIYEKFTKYLLARHLSGTSLFSKDILTLYISWRTLSVADMFIAYLYINVYMCVYVKTFVAAKLIELVSGYAVSFWSEHTAHAMCVGHVISEKMDLEESRRTSLNAVSRLEACAFFTRLVKRRQRGWLLAVYTRRDTGERKREERNHTKAVCYRLLGKITANDFPVAIGVYRSTNVPRAARISTSSVNRAVFPRPPLITPFVLYFAVKDARTLSLPLLPTSFSCRFLQKKTKN